MNDELDIESHYRDLFGPPSREATFVPPSGPRIRVWKWDEQASKQGVNLYATLGASSSLVGDQRRCEFFVGLRPEADGIAENLAEVALRGNGSPLVPIFGDTITLAQPLWPATEMRTFLFTSGGEQIIAPLKFPGEVVFIQLVSLYAKELEFKKNRGEPALWELFEGKRVPYWDPSRLSACT